jgi:hypothetical protein
MLEYGIKAITTNPTLITKSDEIIRLVDTRNHQTRAFVIPAKYEEEVQALFKKIAYKKWANDKKSRLESTKTDEVDSIPEALMEKGWKEIEEYLDD